MIRLVGIVILIDVLTLWGCTKWLGAKKNAPHPTEISTAKDRSQILTVITEVKEKSIHVTIDNIPQGSQLHCELDYIPYEECMDSMVIKDLKPGEYLLHVIAKDKDKTVAVGESFFRLGVPAPTVRVYQEHNELELIAEEGLADGAAVLTTEDFEFKFKPRKKITCEANYECSHGDQNPLYWRPCSSPSHMIIKSSFISKGLQYLHIRAKCENKIGPILSHHFYGVDERYFDDDKAVPLTLDFIADRGENKFIFRLMKSDDCMEGELKYSCSTEEPFDDCGDMHVNPPATFKIRAECGDIIGPVLTRKELDE